MKEENKITIKYMVEDAFPKTGEWTLSGEFPKSINLARNTSNKKFVQDWVKTKVLEKYPQVNVEKLEKFVRCKKFNKILKNYQFKIIDLQLENSFKLDTGLIIGCIVRKNTQKAVDLLYKTVYTLLATYLEIDEKVIEERLIEREEEIFNKFSNSKPFAQVGYNPFEA